MVVHISDYADGHLHLFVRVNEAMKLKRGNFGSFRSLPGDHCGGCIATDYSKCWKRSRWLPN